MQKNYSNIVFDKSELYGNVITLKNKSSYEHFSLVECIYDLKTKQVEIIWPDFSLFPAFIYRRFERHILGEKHDKYFKTNLFSDCNIFNFGDFAYHNLAEKHAYELVNRPKAISNFSVENIPNINGHSGISIAADVEVKEDRRTYHSQLQLNDEGMATRAECSCPQFLQHRLTQGVCSHLIAVRLAYAKYDRSKDEKLRWQQSKLFSKRLSNQAPPVTATENKDITGEDMTFAGQAAWITGA